MLLTLLLQNVQEIETIELELKASCLLLFLQLLSVFLHPLQRWLQVVGPDLHGEAAAPIRHPFSMGVIGEADDSNYSSCSPGCVERKQAQVLMV